MPVLIDGNNLMFAAQDTGDPDHVIGRSGLCDALGEWARRSRERVHVVFDGPAPSAALAQQIAHAAIRVSYSGAGVTADDVIEEILDSDSAARRLLVVSSDRAIRAAARRRRARDMRSDEFWALVLRDLARKPRESVENRKEVPRWR
jgi:predicted RNA-binding protein with PIN domain